LRNYNFGGGAEARVEETLHLSRWASVGLNGYVYWLGTYEGVAGNSLIGIIKPKFMVNLSSTISLGLEHHIYYHNRYAKNLPDLKLVRTEQRFFLQVFLEDGKRKGRYN
jgi:hypothetical protein